MCAIHGNALMCPTVERQLEALLVETRAAGYQDRMEVEPPAIHLTGPAAEQLGFLIQRERDRVDRVEAVCKAWDALTKGESPTTKRIREAMAYPETT